MYCRIWKYELNITSTQEVRMPRDAKILSVDNQDGILCLWALVNANDPKEVRHIEIIGTDNPISTDPEIRRKFIGTVLMSPFVWHVFEKS